MKRILDMFFLTFNNAKILFTERKLGWYLYIPAKALSIIKQVQIMLWSKFAIAALDLDKEVFVVYITNLDTKISIYSSCKAQITLLVSEKVTIPAKYLDFLDLFLKESVAELPERFNINEHLIDLKPGK